MNSNGGLIIDIEKHSALVLMPFIEGTASSEENAQGIMEMGSIDGFVVSRDGLAVSVSVWYEYGKIIGENVWEMFGMDSLIGIVGKQESDQMTKAAVLEAVKQTYPMILKTLEASAKKRWGF